MQTASTALASAIVAQRRVISPLFKADFNRDNAFADYSNYAENFSFDRSLTTDVPDQTRLVTGTSTANGQVQCGGDPTGTEKPLSYNWSPWNTSSAIYGQRRVMTPVQVSVGFDTTAYGGSGVEYMRRFTGRIRLGNGDGNQGYVQWQPVDQASLMRRKIVLPMVTNLGHPGLDNRYFVDYILTANGIDPGDCDLEESLNPLTATPYTGSRVDAWGVIQDLAKSEFACAFFDENNVFHWWNRNHFRDQTVDFVAKTVTVNGVTSPIPTITSTRDLKTVNWTETVDSVVNHVTVNFQPLEVLPSDWVWQASGQNPIALHSRETRTVWANFDNPVQSLDTTVNFIALGGSTGGHSGYRACTTPDGTGTSIENLVFTVTAFAQSAKITIYNPNRHPVYLVSAQFARNGDQFPDDSVGQQMLFLRGRAVVAKPGYATATDGSSGASVDVEDALSEDPTYGYGEQEYTHDGGGWIQDHDTAVSLAQDLLALLQTPFPYLGDVDIVGDPRLQLGDRVELDDDYGTKMDSHFWIVGIHEELSNDGGYAMTLTLRQCAGIGAWILGSPTASQLGSTTILGGVY